MPSHVPPGRPPLPVPAQFHSSSKQRRAYRLTRRQARGTGFQATGRDDVRAGLRAVSTGGPRALANPARRTLSAQTFDEGRMELLGDAVSVVQQVGSNIAAGLFSASVDGVLVSDPSMSIKKRG